MLELDSELLLRPAPRLGHQRHGVRGAGTVRVLDEVRMAGRDLGTPDPVALEATRLEHPAGRQLVLGVLEHAPERALVRGLSCLAERLQLRDRGLDLLGRSRLEPQLRAGDHLAVTET